MSRAYGNNDTERAILLSVGATPHKNSGRGMVKADGHDNMFVIDVKETEKSFSINKKVWDKVCSDAYQVDPNKNPQLLVVLGGRKKLAVVESYVLRGLQRENDALCIGFSDLQEEVDLLKEEIIRLRREIEAHEDHEQEARHNSWEREDNDDS